MQEILGSFVSLFATLWSSVRKTFLAILKVVLTFVFQFVPLQTIAHFVREKMPGLWNWLMSLQVVKKALSFAVIRKFGRATAPRPHAYTMNADFPNWEGLTDKTINARHLPPHDAQDLPPIEDLEELFLRKSPTGDQTDDIRSNVLFASFAQWFTDSFLRTAHNVDFDGEGNAQDLDGVTIKRKEGREVRNESNHEIDLCQIYGMSPAATRQLRVAASDADPERGCLRGEMIGEDEFPAPLLAEVPAKPTSPLSLRDEFKGLHPEPLLRMIFRSAGQREKGYERLWAVGLEHGNSTIGNSLYNVLFFRQHNALARQMARAHPNWGADEVFERTRSTMIVLLLKIVVSDYIRHISPLDLPLGLYPGMGQGEDWYRPNRIHVEFNILYRWHGLVPDQFPFLPANDDPVAQFGQFRHNNDWLVQTGIAGAIDALASAPAGKMTMGNTPQVLRGVKRDTLRLMRAARLQPFNAYRERFGLKKVTSFKDLTGEDVISAKLSDLYGGDIERLEWYVGMVAEQHAYRSLMGDMLFTMVAHDAFTHAVTNPLLADDIFKPETFGPEGWAMIENTTRLKDMVDRVAPGAKNCQFSVA